MIMKTISNIVAVRIGTERQTKPYYSVMTNRRRRNKKTKLVVNVLKTKELLLRPKLPQRVKIYLRKSIQHNLVSLRLIERWKSNQPHQRKEHDNRMLRSPQSELWVAL